jgi:hypothetical protein
VYVGPPRECEGEGREIMLATCCPQRPDSSLPCTLSGQSWRLPFQPLTLSAAADHRTGTFWYCTERVEKKKRERRLVRRKKRLAVFPGLPLTTQVSVVQLGLTWAFMYMHARVVRLACPRVRRRTLRGDYM